MIEISLGIRWTFETSHIKNNIGGKFFIQPLHEKYASMFEVFLSYKES